MAARVMARYFTAFRLINLRIGNSKKKLLYIQHFVFLYKNPGNCYLTYYFTGANYFLCIKN